MLVKWETAIGEGETVMELGERLAIAGADVLVRTLRDLNQIMPQPQNPGEASYAPILKKEDGHIQWRLTAREIANRVRGFLPWPGAYGFLRGSHLHVWRARIAELALAPGVLRAE